ncbi:peamaclein-like [Chenopodium quinoa]|uniref:peamaclein-like n=1 Tax=Chenopodium quinoa TaxID=63459 RepID=UPI000B77D5D6|nr:peamaclein-like [Chenopodium quinoa]XP_021761863.1 peamaclein-like [Chenopodium quinoa]
MKFSVPTLVIISLVITCAFIEIVDAVSASPTTSPTQAPPGVPGFCVDKCAYRCSRNPRNLCKKLCMHCCKKCQCVPNGPFADKSQCPCYRDLKNDEGQSKCP